MGGMTAPVAGSGAEPTCTALVSKRVSSNDMRCSKLALDSNGRAAKAQAPFNTTSRELTRAGRAAPGAPGQDSWLEELETSTGAELATSVGVVTTSAPRTVSSMSSA
jgi:hypothetical protein